MGTWCRPMPVLQFSGKNVKTMYHHAKYERQIEGAKLKGKYRNQLLAQHRLGCLNINQEGTSVDDVEN